MTQLSVAGKKLQYKRVKYDNVVPSKDAEWFTGQYTKIKDDGKIVTHFNDPPIDESEYFALCCVYGIPFLTQYALSSPTIRSQRS